MQLNPLASKTLKGKKIIIFIEEIFNDHEFWYPYYRLKETGAEVVVDGNLITSRTPDDLPAFMRTIIQEIEA